MNIGVIGGGVVGATTALALAEAGAKVTVFENESSLFARSSAAGFGSLTPFSDPFFSGAARDFAARSVSLYRTHWIPRASEALGRPVDFGDEGLLDLFADEPQVVEGVKRLHDELVSAGYPTQMLDRRGTQQLEPALEGEFAGSLWMDEPWLDVQQYFAGLSALLQSNPAVSVRCGVAVEEVSISGNCAIARLTGGSIETFDFVVVATGLSSRRVRLPFEPQLAWVRGDAIEVRTLDSVPLLKRHVYHKSAFITPRTDGRLLLGATYDVEDLEPAELDQMKRDTIAAGQALELLDANTRVVPRIRGCDIVRMWRGWRPKPIDAMPIIGPVGGGQIVIATGFIGLGITMAPAAAQAVASLILHGDGSQVPSEFLPNRFAL